METEESAIAAIVKGGRLVGIVTISHLQAFISLHVLSRKGRILQ